MIPIDRYETALEDNHIVYYAVKGKQRYPVSSSYASMCNDRFLAIMEVTRPDIDIYSSTKEYIPLNTE